MVNDLKYYFYVYDFRTWGSLYWYLQHMNADLHCYFLFNFFFYEELGRRLQLSLNRFRRGFPIQGSFTRRSRKTFRKTGGTSAFIQKEISQPFRENIQRVNYQVCTVWISPQAKLVCLNFFMQLSTVFVFNFITE